MLKCQNNLIMCCSRPRFKGFITTLNVSPSTQDHLSFWILENNSSTRQTKFPYPKNHHYMRITPSEAATPLSPPLAPPREMGPPPPYRRPPRLYLSPLPRRRHWQRSSGKAWATPTVASIPSRVLVGRSGPLPSLATMQLGKVLSGVAGWLWRRCRSMAARLSSRGADGGWSLAWALRPQMGSGGPRWAWAGQALPRLSIVVVEAMTRMVREGGSCSQLLAARWPELHGSI
jgi:hypothetical protein